MTRIRSDVRLGIVIAVLAFCVAMIAFSFASLALPGGSAMPNRPTIATFIAASLAFASLPSMGAALAILRPANPIGWLFLTCGTGFIYSVFTSEYVGRVVYADAVLPLASLVDWIGSWLGLVSIGIAVVWIPLLFPDGHLLGPRWRPVAWAAAAFVGLGALAQAIVPDPAHGYSGGLPNPVGISGPAGEVAAVVALLFFPAMAILGVLALVSVIVRFRRSSGAERAQLKWFLFAVSFFVVAIVLAIVTTSDLAWLGVILGLASLPIAAAVAILRYRLYDIDRLVSRSIAYAAVTGTLVVVYLLLNLGLTTVFSFLTRGDSVAVAASTLVVAALFTPVRRRVQRIVDRRFDRARYDADQTALAFSSRLRDEVDLPAVTADLDATVRAAIAPTTVGVWLRGAKWGAKWSADR